MGADDESDDFTKAENEAARKYLLIKVPDFAIDPAGDPNPSEAIFGADKAAERAGRYGLPMTSYLRLGVPKEDDIGDELIEHAYAVGAVGFTGALELSNAKKLSDGTMETVPVAFVDDERNRGHEASLIEPHVADGHGLTKDERYNFHTRHLKARGGWRDHSDGNRITTTYGDKVEVIRGNYKLVVMGRQDDPGNSQGHEWCGNHVQDWGQGTMPGASVTLEWIQSGNTPPSPINMQDPEDPTATYKGGSWLLINSTERVYQYSRNAGNFRTQQWGEKLEAYVGSEDPESWGTTAGVGYKGHPTAAEDAAYHKVEDDNDLTSKLLPSSIGLPRGNPHMISKTWARRIDNYTGTTNWPIPKVYEETWVTDKESKENITTLNEKSTIVTKTSDETVTTVTETSKIGTQVSTTFAGAVVDTTFVGASNETVIAGAKNEITVAGLMGEITLALGKGSVEIMAGALELSIIGIKRALTIGVGKEWKIGEVEEIPIPKKTTITIDDLKLSISSTRAILSSSRTTLNEKTAAMIAQHKAMQMYLGA